MAKIAQKHLNGFPRTRGDRPKVKSASRGFSEVPPHTRG